MEQHSKPQFVELALKDHCPSDCSSCPSFPAPFRRINESTYCRFAPLKLRAGDSTVFHSERLVRILFVMSGSAEISHDGAVRPVAAGQCVCLERGARYEVAPKEETSVFVLSLIHRIEFCEQDIFNEEMPFDTAVPTDPMPQLATHPSIGRMLADMMELGEVKELTGCARYHKMKAAELFMMIKVLYTPAQHAYFFQSMIQPQDNFRVFVCNNYDKADGVVELAALAGMSLSVFKRRFAEHFNDSVYHWMMRQKALKIFTDIRDGEDNTKVLMDRYGFRHYTQFSRFCKNYLQATPAQLIASIKEG